MDTYNELFLKFTNLLKGGSIDYRGQTDEFKRLAESKVIRLDTYYEIWRRKLTEASRTNTVLSNGWAFSTLSGLSLFETHVRCSELRDIYRNRPAEVTACLNAILEALGNSKIGGIVVYGYGNLIRESQFIECAKQEGILKSQRVYLIDCSLFYYILAKSNVNPLLKTIKPKQMKVWLLDYLEGKSASSHLKEIRDDLNPTKPVLHLFLGNTFCNIEAEKLKQVLATSVRAGDFVVGEYAHYPPEHFAQITQDDYATDMARRSAAELFSLPLTAVSAINERMGDSLGTKIQLTEHDTEICFNSMLRRNFQHSELTNDLFRLVKSDAELSGHLRLDTFIRLEDPAKG